MNNFQRGLALVGALLLSTLPVQAQDSGEGLSAKDIIAKLAPKKTRAIGVGTGGVTEEQKGELEEIFDPARSIGLKERKKIAAIEEEAKMPSLDFPIYFGYNSAEISEESFATLKILGEALASDALSKSIFLVKGHTDSKGNAGYNQRLSEARAGAVVEYLASKYSIDAKRLKAIGYGESQIKIPDDPESGDNRRVELVNTTL